MKISLLIVCTRNYLDFLPGLLASADAYFFQCGDFEIEYCIFTDRTKQAKEICQQTARKVKVCKVKHKKFPHATLKRFHFFDQHWKKITGDYIFYMDADTKFFDHVGSEILSDLVATQHCGYVGRRGTYEAREDSTASVKEGEGDCYFVGSFLGGRAGKFWEAVEVLKRKIEIDETNGITAIWWDESHWNRYLIDNPPTLILSPSFHFPQGGGSIFDDWLERGVFFPPKIIALKKNHNEIRET